MSTSNAMAAKARAMFGERLTAADYAALLNHKSVGEIAAYLKTRPLYSPTLEGLNERAVHRAQLEVQLRMNVLDRFSELIRYASSDMRHFAGTVVMESEAALIVARIRSFGNESLDDRMSLIAQMPMYAEEYLSFDIRRLADVRDFRELLELLKGTVYYDAVQRHAADRPEDIDYVGLEHSLRSQIWESSLQAVRNSGSRESCQAIENILHAEIELENISTMYRLKKYFQAPSEEVQRLMLPVCCHFSEAEIRDMAAHASADEIIARLQRSPYKRYISTERFTYIEHYTKMIRYNMAYHYLETSTAPNLVLMCYLLTTGIEIENVIEIVEGVRYGITQDRIRALLVY